MEGDTASNKPEIKAAVGGDGGRVAVLSLHDDPAQTPAFDPAFVLPSFMRPKAKACNFTRHTTFVTLVTIVLMFVLQYYI